MEKPEVLKCFNIMCSNTSDGGPFNRLTLPPMANGRGMLLIGCAPCINHLSDYYHEQAAMK